MISPPTGDELTRAWLIALRGDNNITEEERDFVLDVMRREANYEATRYLAFVDSVMRGMG